MGADLYSKFPAREALAVTYDTSISSSTEITLNAATEYIQVTALSKPVFLAWGTDNASTSNFDMLIPVDTPTVLKVPPGVTAVNFLEQASAATIAVVEL